jgi:WD40 repeat protein
LHGELVEAYRSRCDGIWSKGVDDGYFYRFLPYHLSAAGHASEVRELLLAPSWIEAKLRHGDIVDILEDYGKHSNDRATQVMADAVRLSADILASNADEVIPQLLGRIDGGRFPEFTSLLDTWRGRPRQAAWLCPQAASLVSPGGALIQTMRVDGFKQLSAHSLFAMAMSGEETSPSARQLASLVPHLPDASSDGRLVVHGAGGFIELFDTISRRDTWTTQCPDDYPVVQVALTPDARYVAASAGYWMAPTGADAVHVWHVESKRQVFAVARGGIQGFLISPDARQVVIQIHGGGVEVWSIETGEQMARWECGPIAALVHGVERDDVVVAFTDGTVNVWTLGRDNPRTTIVGNNEQAYVTAVTSDARTVVRAFIDRRLECHRLAGDRLQSNTLRPPGLAVSEPIRGLVITADGQKVISSEAGAIRMWNLAAPAFDIRPAPDGILISMTPDGRYQVVQENDGTVACRDEITSEVITLDGLNVPFGYFSPPDITPDGDWVVYRAADGSHKIWDTSTGAHVMSLTDSVLSPAISCDSRAVYLRRGAGLWTLRLKPYLRLDTARPVRFENVDPADIISLAVVPGSPTVIILTTSGAFSWHLDEPAPRRVVARDGWQFQRQNVTTGLHAVRADDRWLFAWGWQQGEVWDMHSATMVLDLDFDAPISTAAFTPTGRGLLVAVDRFVTLWDIKSGLTGARFTADAPIHAIACPSDTSFIAASSDGRVHRLDVRKPVANAAIYPIQRRGSPRP